MKAQELTDIDLSRIISTMARAYEWANQKATLHEKTKEHTILPKHKKRWKRDHAAIQCVIEVLRATLALHANEWKSRKGRHHASVEAVRETYPLTGLD